MFVEIKDGCVPYYTNTRLAGTKGSEEDRWRELLLLSCFHVIKKRRFIVEVEETLPEPTPFRVMAIFFCALPTGKDKAPKRNPSTAVES